MTLILIRGLLGSGKTTIAGQIDAKHIEADMFFEKEGKYCFEGNKIQDAHAWCQAEAKYHLYQGKQVVVSNTFTTIREIESYVDIAKLYKVSLKILECNGSFDSVHSIPIETMKRMKNRWQNLPKHLDKYKVDLGSMSL